MAEGDLSRDAVRTWLIEYAWLGSADEQRRTVDCIMAQDDWRYIDVQADRFAGAQEETGPEAYARGVEWALSALYECHDGPHAADCPAGRND